MQVRHGEHTWETDVKTHDREIANQLTKRERKHLNTQKRAESCGTGGAKGKKHKDRKCKPTK